MGDKKRTAFGMLSEYANPELRKYEDDAITIAVIEKYGTEAQKNSPEFLELKERIAQARKRGK